MWLLIQSPKNAPYSPAFFPDLRCELVDPVGEQLDLKEGVFDLHFELEDLGCVKLDPFNRQDAPQCEQVILELRDPL